MAGSLNKVMLIGRLGRDPEARNLTNGGKVVSLRLATSERFKGRDGEQQERTEWHSVVIFNEKLGEIAEKYLRKGSPCYVEGQLQTRKWQGQDGQDKYSTEVVLTKFGGGLTLLGDGRKGGGGEDDADRGEAPEPGRGRAQAMSGGGGGFGPGKGVPSGRGWEDDDIPFDKA